VKGTVVGAGQPRRAPVPQPTLEQGSGDRERKAAFLLTVGGIFLTFLTALVLRRRETFSAEFGVMMKTVFITSVLTIFAGILLLFLTSGDTSPVPTSILIQG
jgi:hypothetical protein